MVVLAISLTEFLEKKSIMNIGNNLIDIAIRFVSNWQYFGNEIAIERTIEQ
jgi:hypothetical protein